MPWTDSEKDQFYKRLTVLAETMGEPMSPIRLTGYCEALEPVPFPAVLIGLRAAAEECRFFPKPAEIRELGVESREWRRLREAAFERTRPRFLPRPRMSDEEMAANIEKLKRAVGRLSAGKRMR